MRIQGSDLVRLSYHYQTLTESASVWALPVHTLTQVFGHLLTREPRCCAKSLRRPYYYDSRPSRRASGKGISNPTRQLPRYGPYLCGPERSCVALPLSRIRRTTSGDICVAEGCLQYLTPMPSSSSAGLSWFPDDARWYYSLRGLSLSMCS